MTNVLDRYILRSLLVNYAIALGAMLSLYVGLDMFVNMDEFTEVRGRPIIEILGNIVSYYVPNLFLYFSQLSGAILMFACMATLARMRKLNELTAVLSSGVSLYRLARPIVVFAIAMTALHVIDTELLIPAMAHKLARDHDDVDGARAHAVLFLRDRDNGLLSSAGYDPRTGDLRQLLVVGRDEAGNMTSMIEADRAVWEPPVAGRPSGRWLLERGRKTIRVRSQSTTIGPRETRPPSFPRYYESDLSPASIQVRQSEGWIRFLSLAQLSELRTREPSNALDIVRTQHERRAQPIVSLVMLFLGVPFFLNRSPSNILGDASKCMLVTGTCYVCTFVANSLRPESMSALPSWLPIFVFGTLAVVLIDRIRT